MVKLKDYKYTCTFKAFMMDCRFKNNLSQSPWQQQSMSVKLTQPSFLAAPNQKNLYHLFICIVCTVKLQYIATIYDHSHFGIIIGLSNILRWAFRNTYSRNEFWDFKIVWQKAR